MITLPRSSECAPALGSWFLSGKAPLRVVCVRCPDCGRDSTLHITCTTAPDTGHRIAIDGVVRPSIVCPHAGCSWHVWARLASWPGQLE